MSNKIYINYDDVAYRLRKHRERKGLTLENVSSDTGIPKSTISKIELDPMKTSLENIVTLATHYDVSLDYLLGLRKHSKILKTDMSELSVTPKAVDKLKSDKRRGKMISKLIELDCFDEFLDRLEVFISGHMETAYSSLNTTYKLTLENIKKQRGADIPFDEVINILNHAEVSNDFERYKIKEFVDVMLDEMVAKFGNKIVEDKSKHSPLNELMGAAMGEGTPSIANIFGDMSDEKLKAMVDGIDKLVKQQNYKIKRK